MSNKWGYNSMAQGRAPGAPHKPRGVPAIPVQQRATAPAPPKPRPKRRRTRIVEPPVLPLPPPPDAA